jgi:uncharacterized Rossmann fold enzyme
MAIFKLNPVNISAAYPPAEISENIRASLMRPYGRLHHLPEFGKDKKGRPIALAGGGPSLKRHIKTLRRFDTVLAAGSSHDFLVEHGVRVKYSLLLDAHSTVTASYIKYPSPDTTYLVATHCPESVFKALEGYPISMWHCIMDSQQAFLEEIEPGYQGLGGGCTSGLRAIYMAGVLGYKNLHLFGYDSCLPDDDMTHAYPLQDEKIEREGIAADRIYEIRFGIGEPGEKLYRCLGYQLAQAQNFEELIFSHHDLFKCTFYGGGLLSDIYDKLMQNKDKLKQKVPLGDVAA